MGNGFKFVAEFAFLVLVFYVNGDFPTCRGVAVCIQMLVLERIFLKVVDHHVSWFSFR